MTNETIILTITALSVGFFHTLLGPDHYLPFVVLAKANNWKKMKTLWVTTLCGLGHVGSSIVLGLVGIAFGLLIPELEMFESIRGSLAAWLFIIFGFTYFVWGIHRAIKNKPHVHQHLHIDGTVHEHKHTHHNEHTHVHETSKTKKATPFFIFTIFLLGPCEPLIPIFIYPAAEHNIFAVFSVVIAFTIATLSTMLGLVFVSLSGLNLLSLKPIEKYMHAIAGATIMFSGIGIQFLGL